MDLTIAVPAIEIREAEGDAVLATDPTQNKPLPPEKKRKMNGKQKMNGTQKREPEKNHWQ